MRLAVAAIVFAMVLVSCGGPSRKPPPKIDVIPKGEVTSRMWSLADYVNQLDGLMRAGGEGDVDQDEVVSLLDQIARTARQLASEQSRHTHPLLAGNIDSFVAAIARARAAAARQPPNYYFTGALTSACVYCHDPNGGIR